MVNEAEVAERPLSVGDNSQSGLWSVRDGQEEER